MALVTTALVVLSLPQLAHAKTFEVTREDDPPPGKCRSDDCSLREAVIAANERKGPDRVALRSKKTYALQIAGSGEDESATGDIDLLARTTIAPKGKARATIDAGGIDRVIHALARAKLSRLVITGGASTQANQSGFGIYAEGFRVDVSRSVITGNSGTNSNTSAGGVRITGGGSLIRTKVTGNSSIAGAGGAFVTGTFEKKFTVSRSIFKNNEGSNSGGLGVSTNTLIDRSKIVGNTAVQCGGADLNGGAVLFRTRVVDNETVPNMAGAFGGGGVCMGSDSEVIRSTIAQNFAAEDGGAIEVFGGKRIVDSLISDNTANGQGGGVSVLFSQPFVIEGSTFAGNSASTDGGGLRAGSATVIVKSSTFVANDGVLGGAIVANDQPTGSDDSVVDLRWSTVVGNNAGSGGGLGSEDGGSFVAEGTIIADNQALANPDCSGLFSSSGHNLISEPSGCAFASQGSDRLGVPATLAKLGDYGGFTPTLRPKGQSIAIDTGGNGCPGKDQRDVRRPRGPKCDIGAVER